MHVFGGTFFSPLTVKMEEAFPFYQASRLHVSYNASLIVTEDTNMFDF
jgi:hypothetical protein